MNFYKLRVKHCGALNWVKRMKVLRIRPRNKFIHQLFNAAVSRTLWRPVFFSYALAINKIRNHNVGGVAQIVNVAILANANLALAPVKQQAIDFFYHIVVNNLGIRVLFKLFFLVASPKQHLVLRQKMVAKVAYFNRLTRQNVIRHKLGWLVFVNNNVYLCFRIIQKFNNRLIVYAHKHFIIIGHVIS